MLTRPKSVRQLVAGRSDAIRIVPLHHPQALQASSPQLTYRNGPLMAAAEVFTVFWSTEWNVAPLNAMMQEINQFFDYILTSALIDQLVEYNVASYKISHGKRTGTAVITPAALTSVNDKTIQHELETEIASNNAFPQPSGNTLYFVFTPPGVKVVQGGASSCQAFCGYHNDINEQVFYAVMPYPNCAGCTGGLKPFDALTSTSSHELCEAITDPIPGQGWYDDSNGEIGDICAWKTRQMGKYTVQLEWSNNGNQCI
ncbi:MAG TPA: hypothetical protein VOA64_15840 [Candidatus Dormibacteraeota bacterium]|nr:hypothetical protein [Candidatus Dormibacteraeota bacterium]